MSKKKKKKKKEERKEEEYRELRPFWLFILLKAVLVRTSPFADYYAKVLLYSSRARHVVTNK